MHYVCSIRMLISVQSRLFRDELRAACPRALEASGVLRLPGNQEGRAPRLPQRPPGLPQVLRQSNRMAEGVPHVQDRL